MKNRHFVLQAFRRPQSVDLLSLAEWDMLIRQARYGNVLASLHALLEEQGMLDAVPAQPKRHLEWAWAVAERHSQAVLWEVSHIRKALSDVGVPVMLLKGAAYAFTGLPPARGRIFSDIDIMVPKKSLDRVEAALMLYGWATLHTDDYDQRYYRNWMHELPPMQHIKRRTVIDVHHAIVPETAPVHPDPALLLEAARAVDGADGLTVLAPPDMVLHSAVHLFHDGEFDNGLRDLIDIHRLLSHFGASPDFWPLLLHRARELELERPLFYALRYARQMLGTSIPRETIEAANTGSPGKLMLALMDQLFLRGLVPDHSSCTDRFTGIAKQLLYVRANSLRMSPFLLARHLFHKAFISPKGN